jgi:hypothetical protein
MGGWQLSQPAPGQFIWTSRLGRRYHVRPPLIIQPLPEPIPRRSPPYRMSAARHDPDSDDADLLIWRDPPEPEPEPELQPQPQPTRPDPADEIPPF